MRRRRSLAVEVLRRRGQTALFPEEKRPHFADRCFRCDHPRSTHLLGGRTPSQCLHVEGPGSVGRICRCHGFDEGPGAEEGD